MTDLCAYLTTFFCSISQGLNREKRRVPFADTIGTVVQTALPFLSTGNRVIQYYGEFLYALCFIKHFRSSTSFLTDDSFTTYTGCLFSPPLFIENCRDGRSWLVKDRTYELLVSRSLMLYSMNNHLTLIFFNKSSNRI